MIKVLVHGANGAMGRTIQQLLDENYAGCVLGPKVSRSGGEGVHAGFDKVNEASDVILDFSFHGATLNALNYALHNKIPIVVGTTGHTDQEKEQIINAANSIPVFYSGNMSLGIAVLCELTQKATEVFKGTDVEIIEMHHNRKEDAPSGTAFMIAESISKYRPEAKIICGRNGIRRRKAGDIGISSVRIGSIVGTHSVLMSTGTESLILTHEAHSRILFAEGALRAAAFIAGRAPGFYSMEDLIKEEIQ